MRVYIIRHGKAAQDSASGGDDDRALKGRGRRQAAWLGEWLAGEGRTPEVVVSSPILRAQQTAEIIVEMCGAPLRLEEDLSTRSQAGRVVDLLGRQEAESVAIVGHNPTLEQLAGVLSAGMGVRIRTGEMVVVEGEAEPGGARIVEVLRLEE